MYPSVLLASPTAGLAVVAEAMAAALRSKDAGRGNARRRNFWCRVLVLLRKILDFLAFTLNLYVVNKKSDIAAER